MWKDYTCSVSLTSFHLPVSEEKGAGGAGAGTGGVDGGGGGRIRGLLWGTRTCPSSALPRQDSHTHLSESGP